MDQRAIDNRAVQKNPNNKEYGGGQKADKNRGEQLNPNNPKYQHPQDRPRQS